MNFTDFRWTGSPADMSAALAALGHPDFSPPRTPADPRVLAFGPAGMSNVMGRSLMFGLIRVAEGTIIDLPAGCYAEPGQMSEVATGVFIAAPRPVTYKTDVWMRCTDDEAAYLTAALGQASPKMKGMWADCQQIEHSSPFFSTLRSQMGSVFGELRAAELLAPSALI